LFVSNPDKGRGLGIQPGLVFYFFCKGGTVRALGYKAGTRGKGDQLGSAGSSSIILFYFLIGKLHSGYFCQAAATVLKQKIKIKKKIFFWIWSLFKSNRKKGLEPFWNSLSSDFIRSSRKKRLEPFSFSFWNSLSSDFVLTRPKYQDVILFELGCVVLLRMFVVE
jgi:hypothetical protein